jgi:hypothetical protein
MSHPLRMIGGMVEVIGLEHVRRQVDELRGLVAGLDPDAVALPEAPGMWQAFAGISRLADAAQMLLARRVEQSSVWQQAGCRSAAEYLSRTSGGSVRGANELLRASKKVAQLPAVDAALRRGELSVSQAELIADAASAEPAKEQHLLELAARVPLMELAQECGRVKAGADPDPEETYWRIHANRRLRQRTDGEGAWCLYGRGTPDAGALVNHALGPLIDEQYDQARRAGRHEHRDTYAWDAFIELIRRYLNLDDLYEEPEADEADNAEACDVDPENSEPTSRTKILAPRTAGPKTTTATRPATSVLTTARPRTPVGVTTTARDETAATPRALRTPAEMPTTSMTATSPTATARPTTATATTTAAMAADPRQT